MITFQTPAFPFEMPSGEEIDVYATGTYYPGHSASGYGENYDMGAPDQLDDLELFNADTNEQIDFSKWLKKEKDTLEGEVYDQIFKEELHTEYDEYE